MNIGYARVSTQDQTLALQKDALEKIGCNKIFTDTASGTKAERKGLEEALETILKLFDDFSGVKRPLQLPA